MRSTLPAQADDMALALFVGAAHEALDEDLALTMKSVLRGCLSETGNRTSGSPFEYAAHLVAHGEDALNILPMWVSRIVDVNELLFSHLAAIVTQEELRRRPKELWEEIDVFAEWLGVVPGVEELKVTQKNGGFETWVVVSNASEEVRYAIYDLEWELMRRFPHRTFDFHLVDRQGVDLSSVLSFGQGTLTLSIEEGRDAR